jgi:hypothetical protein
MRGERENTVVNVLSTNQGEDINNRRLEPHQENACDTIGRFLNNLILLTCMAGLIAVFVVLIMIMLKSYK